MSWFTSLLQLEIGPSGSIYIIGKHGKSGLFYFPQRWLLNIYQNTTASSLLTLFLEVGVQSFFFPKYFTQVCQPKETTKAEQCYVPLRCRWLDLFVNQYVPGSLNGINLGGRRRENSKTGRDSILP